MSSVSRKNIPRLLNFRNLSFDKYEYNQPFKTQQGNYLSVCNYRLSPNEQVPLFIESPKLKTTSGIVKVDNKFYIDLELSQLNENGSFYKTYMIDGYIHEDYTNKTKDEFYQGPRWKWTLLNLKMKFNESAK